VAGPSLARAIADSEGEFLNTDDRTLVEFAFARSVGRDKLFDPDELWETAHTRREDRPELRGGQVAWDRIEDERIASSTAAGVAPSDKPYYSAERRARTEAQSAYTRGDLEAALAAWRAQPREPIGPVEVAMVATAIANTGDDAALRYIDQLRGFQPVEADALLGLLRWKQGKPEEASEALAAAFSGYRDDPWPTPAFMSRMMDVATQLAAQDTAASRRLYAALDRPFAASALNDKRMNAALQIATTLDFTQLCAAAVEPFEPHVPWTRAFLASRSRCYRETNHPRAMQAEAELVTFLRDEPVPFARDLTTPAGAPPPPSPH
jgi:hypothetical protein